MIFSKNHHFWWYLIPEIDSVAHFLSKNVYFNICYGKNLKVTAVDKFQKFRANTPLKMHSYPFPQILSTRGRSYGFFPLNAQLSFLVNPSPHGEEVNLFTSKCIATPPHMGKDLSFLSPKIKTIRGQNTFKGYQGYSEQNSPL